MPHAILQLSNHKSQLLTVSWAWF